MAMSQEEVALPAVEQNPKSESELSRDGCK
jgi:hypothetical protein